MKMVEIQRFSMLSQFPKAEGEGADLCSLD